MLSGPPPDPLALHLHLCPYSVALPLHALPGGLGASLPSSHILSLLPLPISALVLSPPPRPPPMALPLPCRPVPLMRGGLRTRPVWWGTESSRSATRPLLHFAPSRAPHRLPGPRCLHPFRPPCRPSPLLLVLALALVPPRPAPPRLPSLPASSSFCCSPSLCRSPCHSLFLCPFSSALRLLAVVRFAHPYPFLLCPAAPSCPLLRRVAAPAPSWVYVCIALLACLLAPSFAAIAVAHCRYSRPFSFEIFPLRFLH
ncbi:hypothetical protein PLESTM_001086200 [Pleodorina starrii]|nr:hypothetical protein PLESTM_001086200 [Pleodorina starrii]